MLRDTVHATDTGLHRGRSRAWLLLGNVDESRRALDDACWGRGHFLDNVRDGFPGAAAITIDLPGGIVGFLHDPACDGQS
jgi:hypothetical protein